MAKSLVQTITEEIERRFKNSINNILKILNDGTRM